MKRVLSFLPFLALPLGVWIAHLIASALRLYVYYPNADIPFHFAGGFSIAYMVTQVLAQLEKEQRIAPLHGLLLLALACCATAMAAVLWEFAEFGADRLFGTNVQVSLANTMQDQFMGLCGGLTWALFHYKKAPGLGRERDG